MRADGTSIGGWFFSSKPAANLFLDTGKILTSLFLPIRETICILLGVSLLTLIVASVKSKWVFSYMSSGYRPINHEGKHQFLFTSLYSLVLCLQLFLSSSILTVCAWQGKINDIERFCSVQPSLSDLLYSLWIMETREIAQFEDYCSTNCFYKSFPKALAPSLRVFSCRVYSTNERYRMKRKALPQWFTFSVQ